MKRLDYLKLVLLETKLYQDLKWITKAFALPIGDIIGVNELDLYIENKKFYTIYKEQKEYITDVENNKPLFSFNEEINIDNSYGVNIDKPMVTKIGNLYINTLAIAPSFGKKIPFQNGNINITKLESLIANKIKDDKDIKDNNIHFISINEMLEFVDRISFISNLAFITNISATPKNITAPPDLLAKKKELLSKYGNDLSDPVKLVQFENELTEIDNEYLKDDPTLNILLTGKTKNVARKKMFLDFGYEHGFSETNKIEPIFNSLNEGWNIEDNNFPNSMNSLRSGSYSRGKETELGGVTYKRLQRALSGLTISSDDCGTTQGIAKDITESNYKNLIYREIYSNNKWLTINNEEEAKKFINKTIKLRSALYCKYEKDGYCFHCLSSLLKDNPTAISILSSELSSSVLYMFMSRMHGTTLSTIKLLNKDLFT